MRQSNWSRSVAVCTSTRKIHSLLHVSSIFNIFFFFSSRRRHTSCSRYWSSDVCSSDLLAGSTVIQRKGATMLARDFKPGFRIALHDKDMGIVTAAAREAGVVIPLGAAVAQLVASLKAQGDGGLDHSALLKLVSQLSGRQERQE